MGGFLTSALALIALQVLLRNAQPTTNAISTIVTAFDHFISPAYPGLPAAQKAKAAASSKSKPGTQQEAPAPFGQPANPPGGQQISIPSIPPGQGGVTV